MTAQELLQQIVDGTAGDYIRYAPVDVLKAAQLLNEMQSAPASGESARSFYDALEAAASPLDVFPRDDSYIDYG